MHSRKYQKYAKLHVKDGKQQTIPEDTLEHLDIDSKYCGWIG